MSTLLEDLQNQLTARLPDGYTAVMVPAEDETVDDMIEIRRGNGAPAVQDTGLHLQVGEGSLTVWNAGPGSTIKRICLFDRITARTRRDAVASVVVCARELSAGVAP